MGKANRDSEILTPPLLDPKPDDLTEKEETFCRFFTQNEILRGNATLSYAEAFGHDLESMPDDDAEYEKIIGDGKEYDELVKDSTRKTYYDMCSSNASRLRRKEKIQNRIITLRNEFLSEHVVDSELAQVILDPKISDVKMSGIKEWNKLKKRTDTPPPAPTQNFFTLFIAQANSRAPIPVESRVIEPEAIAEAVPVEITPVEEKTETRDILKKIAATA